MAGRLESLAERHPGNAKWSQIGTSRLGDPIHLLTIDGGERSALVYAGPLTRRHYAWHFYRPPFNQQAEWTFPVTADDAPIYFDDPTRRAPASSVATCCVT